MPQTPRSEMFNDIYFSPEDGLAETKHVFLDGNNLPERLSEKPEFTICETGFGTGLNFLSTAEIYKGSKLHFISFEKYPLPKDEIETALTGWFPDLLAGFLDAYPEDTEGWHELKIGENIQLTLIFGDVNEEINKLEAQVDAWFLDGFAPSKNPEMWTETVFENMARFSSSGTSFATFTAAGVVRRGLQAVGFDVEKVPGFGRKREMLRGSYRGT